MKVAMMSPLGNHRRRLPKDAFHLARLATTLTADCGACVRITLNMAAQEGSSSDSHAGLRRELGTLPPELADAFTFAEAVARGQDDPEGRERIRTFFGEEGLVELSLAIASSMVFPRLKRALGHAESCSRTRPALLDEGPRSSSRPVTAPGAAKMRL